MYDFLPYVEYWRYGTSTCVAETADDRYDSISFINQLKYDFAKVGRNPWLIQDMRELSQHGRAITIAVDVRLYQLLKGEVRVTRSGKLSIQGRVPAQFWHTVYFEDSKTVIYMRGFEMNVPRGLHRNGKSTEEARTTFENELAQSSIPQGERDAGSMDWRLIPRVKCYLVARVSSRECAGAHTATAHWRPSESSSMEDRDWAHGRMTGSRQSRRD